MCLLSQKDLSVSSAKMTAVWSWANCSISLNFAFLPRLLCALNETDNVKSHSQFPSPSTVPGTESALNKYSDVLLPAQLMNLPSCLLSCSTCACTCFPSTPLHSLTSHLPFTDTEKEFAWSHSGPYFPLIPSLNSTSTSLLNLLQKWPTLLPKSTFFP